MLKAFLAIDMHALFMEVKVTQLCPTLCNSMDLACEAPLSLEFSRQEYWSGLPFPSPGDLPHPGIKPSLLHCRQILYHLNHQGFRGKWWIKQTSCPGEAQSLNKLFCCLQRALGSSLLIQEKQNPDCPKLSFLTSLANILRFGENWDAHILKVKV